MEKYLTAQVFTVAVAVVLLIVFYLLLATSLTTGIEIFTPLILIVIAVICLGIFAEMTNLEKKLSKKR
jgi:hypothetical protein